MNPFTVGRLNTEQNVILPYFFGKVYAHQVAQTVNLTHCGAPFGPKMERVQCMTTKMKNGSQALEGQKDLFPSLRGLITGKTDVADKARKSVDGIREKYPIIADVVGGVAGDGKNAELEPGKLSFFTRDGVFRFSLFVKSAETIFFGDVEDPSDPFGSAEFAMKTGKFSQKHQPVQTNSYTKEQQDVLL